MIEIMNLECLEREREYNFQQCVQNKPITWFSSFDQGQMIEFPEKEGHAILASTLISDWYASKSLSSHRPNPRCS